MLIARKMKFYLFLALAVVIVFAAVSIVKTEANDLTTQYWYIMENDQIGRENAPPNTPAIRIRGSDFVNSELDEELVTIEDDVLVWDDDRGWVDYAVDVPVAGYYNIGMVYDLLNTRSIDVIRAIYINGELQFHESLGLRLKREYVHSEYPFIMDDFGNHRRPRSIQIEGWKDMLMHDFTVSTLPLRFYLQEGSNIIRVEAREEMMKLKELYVTPPHFPIAYAEWAATFPEATNLDGDWIHIIEGEDISRKSNISMAVGSNNEALVSPPTEGLLRFNVLGGEQWKQSGLWTEWEFVIPHDGIYQIGIKFYQEYINNSITYRTVDIDGVPLLDELQLVGFPYGTTWQGKMIGDANDEPLNLYFEAGVHKIRMTATAVPMKAVYEEILKVIRDIQTIEDQIRRVTGNYDKGVGASKGNIDRNRDWDLDRSLPNYRADLQGIANRLDKLADRMVDFTTKTSDTESALRTAASDIRTLLNRPREIPNRLDRIVRMQERLATWSFRMLDQSMAVDYLWVQELGAEAPRTTPSLLQRFVHTTVSFFRTFTIDYEFRRENPNAIDVWVNRGRDYVNLIQQLADETFTIDTGIAVNVNIVPDPFMFILGNAAGIQPDVALGVEALMPVDMAMRGALVDLKQFADYDEVVQRFHPGAMRALSYDSGVYALPEVQQFNVLIYRTDILAALGIEVPDTWDDLARVLPTLQQNGYDFFINPTDFLPFLFQNSGDLYTEDGLETALDTPDAYRAFLQWTDMFTLYQVPREVPNFYMHFRTGYMPIGISDFNNYVMIQFAAPELAGRYAISMIPGVRQEDGSISRWAGGMMQAGMIFGKSDRIDSAWEFLKWWTEEDIQERFGNEIEAIFGPEYRWNTANLIAFNRLPWPRDDLKVIYEQLEWYQEAPNVPGGYFTQRHITFAWNKVVINNELPRVTLDEAVEEINREMFRKQIEFGLRDRQGNIIRGINVPQVTEPWRGVMNE